MYSNLYNFCQSTMYVDAFYILVLSKTIPKNLMMSFRGDVCRAEMDTKFLRAPPGY